MLSKDDKKLTREEILEKPGTITAKIVYNTLIENNFELYYIGAPRGDLLYAVQMNNSKKSLVGFTSQDFLHSYVNRKEVCKNIKKAFGNKIVSVRISIVNIYKLILQTEYKIRMGVVTPPTKEKPIDAVIVNPSDKGSFVPLLISDVAQRLEEDISIDDIDDMDNIKIPIEDIQTLEYDKNSEYYLLTEGDNLIA